METIHISADTVSIVSTSSKGDQSKWLIKEKWVKQNTRGYEDIAEYVASLILKVSTLDLSEYVLYEPCKIQFENGQVTKGCYSLDFRGPIIKRYHLNASLKHILSRLAIF